MYVCKGRAWGEGVGGVRGARHCLSWPRIVFSPVLCDLGALYVNLNAEMFVKRDEFVCLNLCMRARQAPCNILKSEHN